MEHMLGIYKLMTEGSSGEQLFQEAGYHDLMKWGTSDIYHSCSRLAGLHESLHDEFLTSTPFGAVQQAFVRLQKLSDIKYVVKQAKAWSEELVRQSAETHERAATYLSIKMFSPEKQQLLQASLHPTYKELLNDLQDIIDPIFRSSYIQYHVGYAFCELCFASNIAKRLSEQVFARRPRILADEAPNERFNVLAEHFTGKLLGELLKHIMTSIEQFSTDLQLPSNFLVQSETSWAELRHDTAVKLDRLIARKCRVWFYENSAGLLNHAELDDNSRFEVIHNFFINLKVATGVDILTRQDNSLQSVIENIDGTPNQNGIAALKYGKGIIENNPVLRTDKIPSIENETQLYDFCSKEAERRILVTESGKFNCLPDSSWLSLRFDRDEVGAVRCTHIKLVELLKQFKASVNKPLYDFVIVGIEHGSQEDFEKIKKTVHEVYHLAVDKQYMKNKQQRLIWYLDGNILNWWCAFRNNSTIYSTALISYAGLRSASGITEAYKNEKFTQTLQESSHLGCHIFITEGYPGICIRWMNAIAYEGTRCYFSKEIENGGLKVIKGEEQREHLAEKSMSTLNAIKNVWSVL
jgi:hypothetical protein